MKEKKRNAIGGYHRDPHLKSQLYALKFSFPQASLSPTPPISCLPSRAGASEIRSVRGRRIGGGVGWGRGELLFDVDSGVLLRGLSGDMEDTGRIRGRTIIFGSRPTHALSCLVVSVTPLPPSSFLESHQ